METRIYYMPIKSTSLAHYFSKACIYPSKYYENKIEDIQNRYENKILLSNKKWLQQTDCCLELVFDNNEGSYLHTISDNYFFYNSRAQAEYQLDLC